MAKEIGPLTGLRGVAAAWVFLLHVSHVLRSTGGEAYAWAKVLGAAGYLGVDVFFVLSGFVLAHNYAADVPRGGARWYAGFIWKRLARIYPTHIAALVLFCIVMLGAIALGLPDPLAMHRLNLGNLLRTLTLTHAWDIPIARHWNVPSWSISAEFAAYLAFPLIALMAARFRSTLAALGMIVLLFVALASIKKLGSYGGTMAYGLPRIAIEFPAGVLLHRIWTLRGRERGHDLWAALALIGLIIPANLIDAYTGRASAFQLAPILACAVVYFVACSSGSVSRVLSSPMMLTAGRLSYAFYLVHLIVLGLARSIMTEFGWHRTWPALAMMAASAITAALIAAYLYRRIEEPARRAMLRFGFSRSDRRPVDQAASIGPQVP